MSKVVLNKRDGYTGTCEFSIPTLQDKTDLPTQTEIKDVIVYINNIEHMVCSTGSTAVTDNMEVLRLKSTGEWSEV